MAIYSFRLSPIGKTTQKRAFTAAAHIRYITRSGAVSHVMAERMPEGRAGAMRWLRAGEKADRKNARVADKMVIALPRELTRQQQVALVWSFAEQLTQGRASWFAAIHAQGKDKKNPHCHLLVRDRDILTGERVVMFSAGQKEVAQRKAKGKKLPTTLRQIRELWEVFANRALEEAGSSERIDRRTLAEQGVGRRAQLHEGPNIRAMHARGVRPASRERQVRAGLRRSGTPAVRTVRYPEIDLGRTRVEFNLALTASTALRLEDPRKTERGRSYDRVTWPCDFGSRLLAFGMSEPPPVTVASLQADIDKVRAAYARRRADVEGELSRLFEDAPSACDTLLSIADEFGPEHALEVLGERPDEFGHTRADDYLPWSDVIGRAGEELRQLADEHDRLDHLTLQREALLKREDAGRLPVINIQGQEFTLDEAQRELRPTDRANERHTVDLEPHGARASQVADVLAREAPDARAQPEPEKDRTRSR